MAPSSTVCRDQRTGAKGTLASLIHLSANGAISFHGGRTIFRTARECARAAAWDAAGRWSMFERLV